MFTGPRNTYNLQQYISAAEEEKIAGPTGDTSEFNVIFALIRVDKRIFALIRVDMSIFAALVVGPAILASSGYYGKLENIVCVFQKPYSLHTTEFIKNFKLPWHVPFPL